MRISFIPASTDQTASSRIRVYSLQKALAIIGVKATIGLALRSNVLVIQKRVDIYSLSLARSFQLSGGKVIYDFDDIGKALSYWAPDELFESMVKTADLVTTNTIGFNSYIKRRFPGVNAEIIPDIVDYYLDTPVRRHVNSKGPLKVLWFGNVPNIRLLLAYLPALQEVSDIDLRICTDESGREMIPEKYVSSFVPWALHRFPSILQSADISILTHDGDEADRAKSNNRMVTSIAWGVPAIVSNTPEYARTAKLLAVPECISDGPNDLSRAIDCMRSSEDRTAYLLKTQESIWRMHAPHAIASRFLNVVQKLLKTNSPVTA